MTPTFTQREYLRKLDGRIVTRLASDWGRELIKIGALDEVRWHGKRAWFVTHKGRLWAHSTMPNCEDVRL